MMNNFQSQFRSRAKEKKLNIAVIGLGYVGLPLAVEFAKKGFPVLGVDLDKNRVQKLRQKKSYISDIPRNDVKKLVTAGRLKAEAGFHSLKGSDVVLVCVPTPLIRGSRRPDISFVKTAIGAVSKNIKPGALVILESTTYPGTTEEVILPIFEKQGLKHGVDFYLCFSPERIDPGNKKYPLNKIPKVIGGLNKEAGELANLLYRQIIDKTIIVSSPRVAEIVKLLENTFRLINIGLIDEMAIMAHRMNIDIWEVIEAAKTKPFGFMPFYPGPGVGGHCIPKDPLYLYWKARKFGFHSRFIRLASEIISQMPKYITERIRAILQGRGIQLKNAKVLVIGVTYKKDIRDLRKSPSLDIVEILENAVKKVSYHDPLIPYLKMSRINLKSITLSKASLPKFDCVIIATDHSSVDYKFIRENSRLIFDTRNVYKNSSAAHIYKL